MTEDNPAEVLRALAQEIADELGLEVDHQAFDDAQAILSHMVEVQ